MSCGHPCKLPCHPDEECQPEKCTRKVYVTCPCGIREKRTKCYKKQKIGFLTCDDKCAIELRNSNLRKALNLDDRSENIDMSKYRLDSEILEAVGTLKHSQQFVHNLEDVFRCFVNGTPISNSIKGFEQLGDNKLEISSKLKKDKVALKIITAVAPTYDIKVQTVGSANYKFITLIKGPKSRIAPVVLSQAVSNFQSNPNRFKAIECYPPERILVLICNSTEQNGNDGVAKEIVSRLEGEGISLNIYQTIDKHLMCFFPEQSMRNAAMKKSKNLAQVKHIRRGMEGDSEILYIGGVTELYNTEKEEERLRDLEWEEKREEFERKKREARPVATPPVPETFEASNPFDALNANTNESKI